MVDGLQKSALCICNRKCQDAASIVGMEQACRLVALEKGETSMNEQLPISPITGQPSKLRQLVQRSVIGASAGPVEVVPGNPSLTYHGDPNSQELQIWRARLAPGLAPGAQSTGVSPHAATHPVQRAQVQTQPAPAPDAALVAQSIAASLGQALAPIVQELSRAVANAGRQPVTRSAQPGRSIALNTGTGYIGDAPSWNRAVVARSLGFDVPAVRPPRQPLPNAVDLYMADKVALLRRQGIW